MKTTKTLLVILSVAILAICANAQEKIVNAYGTIPQLQGLNPNIVNNVVVVQGLVTAGDGQGGVFAYDATSSATVNTTNTFAPTSYDGRWIRQFGGAGNSFYGDGVLSSSNVQTITGQGGAFALALIPQTAKTFLSGPLSGSAAAPTFISAANAKLSLGVQTGNVTTSADNTVTNTFSQAFSSAPTVVIAQTGNACTVTNALAITSSNFVYGAGSPSIVAKWVAIGAP